MKVAHLIKATRISGAERHLLILLSALRARGVDAHLLILVEDGKLMDNYVAEATARGIPSDRIVIHRHLDWSVIGRIRKRLRKLKPDILHTHLIHADTYGYRAGKRQRIPVIVTSRHNDDNFRRHPMIKGLQRWLWRGYTAGIAISDSIRQFTSEVENAPADKLKVIHYGMEYQPQSRAEQATARHNLRQELGLAEDTLILGMACRLIEQKGIGYALTAFAKLHFDYPDAHLVIAGEGDLRADLEKKVEKYNLQGRVHFLGWREEMPQILAAYDIFLMPSLWEGFGLVLIEAMSKGVPVVASRVSAIPEVVSEEETGLLVPPRDAEALARALRRLLDDRALRLHMGMLAEDRVAQFFTAERMAEQTLALYEELLARKRKK